MYYLKKEGREAKNKIIDKEDLALLYYPGTIHYEDHQLQKVQSFTQDKRGNKKPVFESFEDKKILKLYRTNNYRTFVESEIHYEQDAVLENGLALLNTTPKYLFSSYVNKSEHPFTMVTKREELLNSETTLIFGQLLRVEFYEKPINMAMVIHAFIHALRILYDIDYKNWTYTLSKTVTKTNKKVNELILLDRTISDLLRIIDVQNTILVAKELVSNYLKINKIKSEEQPGKEIRSLVVPLPHKRYHLTQNDYYSFARINDCFNHMKDALVNYQTEINYNT